jgi:hypothetical protein
MHLDDAYLLLDLDPGASDVEIKRAHRDLTKVWHPDRFGGDAALRQKAEHKLKAINEAYETIRSSRDGGWSDPPPPPPPPAPAPEVNRRAWAFASALIAILILLRRPTPAGLVIALILFGVAFVFIARMRRRR